METKKTTRELYEMVREYDDLLTVPNEVKYAELHSMRSGIDILIKEINQFNIDTPIKTLNLNSNDYLIMP